MFGVEGVSGVKLFLQLFKKNVIIVYLNNNMFKSLITLLYIVSIVTAANAHGDTTFYYLTQSGKYLQKKDSADFIRAVVKPGINDKNFIVHDYYLNGKDKFVGHAQKPNGLIFEGYCIEFYPNGNKKSDEFFVNNVLNGPVTTYYPNGKLYMTGKFDMGIVISQCRDTSGRILAANGVGEVIDFNDDFSVIMDRGGDKGWAKNRQMDVYVKGYFKIPDNL